MTAAVLLAVALACGVRADGMGGHPPPDSAAASTTPDQRRATLEEMWQRRLLPPDQDEWSPSDLALLTRMRRVEDEALGYLHRRFGGVRPWSVRSGAGTAVVVRLTKAGYEKYEFLLTQDAIAYFESKGAQAKDVFALKSLEGAALFDADGRLTDDGAALYARADAKLPAFWRGPDGRVYGTRRPPKTNP